MTVERHFVDRERELDTFRRMVRGEEPAARTLSGVGRSAVE